MTNNPTKRECRREVYIEIYIDTGHQVTQVRLMTRQSLDTAECDYTDDP